MEQRLETREEIDSDNFVYIPSINLWVAKERDYLIGALGWKASHEFLGFKDSRMLTPMEFVEFLNYLRKNPSEENTQIYENITQVKEKGSEFLDAYFERRDDGLYVLTRNKTHTEKLDPNTLIQNMGHDPGISLDDWLENPTSQGLPRVDVKRGEMGYLNPHSSIISGFGTGFKGAFLGTGLESSSTYEGCRVGVRAVKEAETHDLGSISLPHSLVIDNN